MVDLTNVSSEDLLRELEKRSMHYEEVFHRMVRDLPYCELEGTEWELIRIAREGRYKAQIVFAQSSKCLDHLNDCQNLLDQFNTQYQLALLGLDKSETVE